jgi:hypothetical protein
MVDEPTGWEMKRAMEAMDRAMRDGLAQINARLDKLVSQDAFQAEQRRRDDQYATLMADIADEKAERVAAIEAEKRARERGDAAQQAQLDKADANRRWLWAAVVIPIAGIIVTVLLARGGGL